MICAPARSDRFVLNRTRLSTGDFIHCSIRENIRLGCLEASDEQIEAAAKAAEIHDFILSLPQPQGYDTSVGDRGGQL